MSERERRRNNDDRNGPNNDDQEDGTDDLASMRQQGSDLLNAGDAIIDGLLSGNSLEFLRNSRQRGGQ